MNNEPEQINELSTVQIPIKVENSDAYRCELDAEGHCITCSDEALPARVLNIDQQTSTALVEVEGAETEIDVSLVEDVKQGDWLLIHGGVAIASIAEQTPGEAIS